MDSLAHAQTWQSHEALELVSGAVLSGVTVRYETYGRLSVARDNAVLVCHAVICCVESGLDVIQSDIDRGLSSFAEAQFDVAILSQTLQAIEDVAGVLDELVRVACTAIVSFPNFAYKPLREMFYREGRIPKSKGLYGYEWYDSPNHRFPSIRDFEELCAAKGIRVDRRIYLDMAAGSEVCDDANLNADIAIVVISRD